MLKVWLLSKLEELRLINTEDKIEEEYIVKTYNELFKIYKKYCHKKGV